MARKKKEIKKEIKLFDVTTILSSCSIALGLIFFVITVVNGFNFTSLPFNLSFLFIMLGCTLFGFGLFFMLMEEYTNAQKNLSRKTK